VAVVGGCGFLASHLTDYLIEERGCKVLVLDNLVAGRREFVHPKATFVHADITGSEDYIRKLFLLHGVEYVFLYSAYPYIPDSFARPVHVFNVNAMGCLKVINAAQESGCKGVLAVSSAEIYGDGCRLLPGEEPYNGRIAEDSPVTPHSTYGASKAAIDFLIQARWREAKTPCIALRQFNCLGERDCTHPYIVVEVIQQLSRQLYDDSRRERIHYPTVYLGNNSSRDFIYAGDAVRCAVELLEKGEFGSVYNLGSETSIKIYDLAKLIGRLMGFADVKIVQDPARVRPWEIWSLLADSSKIYSVIDYRPKVDLEEALRRTIGWFEANGWKLDWEARS
jgi:nucleoside-diphosphate-sugar epimerase